MKNELKASVLALALATAACGGEAPPQPGQFDGDPPIDPDEEEEAPALTLSDALASFGACMAKRLDVWVETGMYNLYQVETVNPQNGESTGACESCHSGVARTGGIVLDKDVVATFREHTHLPAVMRLVTGTIDERGNFKDLVNANRYAEKGGETCLVDEGFECHPTYELPLELQTALTDFTHEMLDRWHNNNCDAPYVPPTEE
jgi:hypothetical protein